MAAAEYFSNTPVAHPSYPQAPTAQPQQYSQQQSYSSTPPKPHIQTQAPPPYSEGRPGVHFAPTPTDLHQRHSFSGQQRPSRASFSSSPQNGYAQPQLQPQQQQFFAQSQNNLLQPRPQYPQQQSYSTPPNNYQNYNYNARPQQLTPHMRPYANPNSSQYSLDSTGYSSDPESRRRRHRHRDNSHSRRGSDEPLERGSGTRSKSGRPHSRSTNADAFVGAAGLGLVGDAIFPGLGTLGGAALGWFGGKDYAHHRKAREQKRSKEQRDWEDKYRPSSRGSSGRRSDYDYRSRAGSTQLGESDRRGSGDYERRNSHY